MENDLFLVPFFIFAAFALARLVLQVQASRKRKKAPAAAGTASGRCLAGRLGEWTSIGGYDVFVHRVTEQVRTVNASPERFVYVDVEYRNESGQENLSCRRNQWRLYDADGHCYKVRSEGSLPGLYRDKPFFGSDCFINPGRKVRGWLAFPVPAEARITHLQFITEFLHTQTIDIPIENAIEAEAREAGNLATAGRLEAIYPILNRAAGDFLRLLSTTDFKGDLVLAAEMAGLKLLRNSGVDLARHTPGHVLLGALPDETYRQMERFLYSWSLSNGLAVDGLRDVKLPREDMDYLPQVSGLEPGFDAICRKHRLQPEDAPYAAALAALKLAAAGSELKLMEASTARYMVYFHILSASKMVPERAAAEAG